MGQVISLVGSRVVRSINRFNAENRAQKVIARDKPAPAPKYEATVKEMETLMRERPQQMEELKRKDQLLDSHLKKVYVVSHDPKSQGDNKDANVKERKLPTSRSSYPEPEFGFEEPETVPVGKVTLKQALKFLAQSHADPTMFNKYYVSDNYKISLEQAENILKYFSTFNIYLPEKKPELSSKVKLQKFLQSQTKIDETIDDTRQKFS